MVRSAIQPNYNLNDVGSVRFISMYTSSQGSAQFCIALFVITGGGEAIIYTIRTSYGSSEGTRPSRGMSLVCEIDFM